MSLTLRKEEETLAAETIRYDFDEFGHIKDPSGKTSWWKKPFKILKHLVGIVFIVLLAYTFLSGNVDFSDWFFLTVQVLVAAIYLYDLWKGTDLSSYYQLSPEYFEIKNVRRHQKFKIAEIESMKSMGGTSDNELELIFRMKSGRYHQLDLPAWRKKDREKIKDMVERLENSVDTINITKQEGLS